MKLMDFHKRSYYSFISNQPAGNFYLQGVLSYMLEFLSDRGSELSSCNRCRGELCPCSCWRCDSTANSNRVRTWDAGPSIWWWRNDETQSRKRWKSWRVEHWIKQEKGSWRSIWKHLDLSLRYCTTVVSRNFFVSHFNIRMILWTSSLAGLHV